MAVGSVVQFRRARAEGVIDEVIQMLRADEEIGLHELVLAVAARQADHDDELIDAAADAALIRLHRQSVRFDSSEGRDPSVHGHAARTEYLDDLRDTFFGDSLGHLVDRLLPWAPPLVDLLAELHDRGVVILTQRPVNTEKVGVVWMIQRGPEFPKDWRLPPSANGS